MLQKMTVRKTYDTKTVALRVAEMLEIDDEDGWTYRVRQTRDGDYVIAIYDGSDFVGYWGD